MKKIAGVLKKSSRGQAMVEFVLIFPVVLLLIMGIIEFALLANAHQVVQYSAFCAARSAIVGSSTHLSAAVANIAISPTSLRGIGIPSFPGLDWINKIFGIQYAIQKLPFAFALTQVSITWYDENGKKTSEDKKRAYCGAKVVYMYPLKFSSSIGVLANYVAKSKSLIPGADDIFLDTGHLTEWLEAKAISIAAGVKVIPIIHTCYMGKD